MFLFTTGKLNRNMARLYNNITNSIAFYPVIITLFYLGLVVGMLWFDYSGIAKELNEEMPWLQFKEMSAVRTILSTLIAGIISLMALSFSMVMVVLNQATSTISPKIMQGLITKKEHQFVLGNQFGAILYFMIVLLLLRSIDFYKIPTFSVALGLLIGFWSLGLFVYFIHNISQNIQVTNIIAGIHQDTCDGLQVLKKSEIKKLRPTPENFKTTHAFITDKPGFFQEVNISALLKVAEKNDFQIEIVPRLTEFVASGCVLFKTSVPGTQISEDQLKEIYRTIIFYKGERISTNYVYGFTQLSEIAVKSLSPGINDPGIAVLCIQYLSDLFIQLYPLKTTTYFADESGNARLFVQNVDFERLLVKTIGPIMHYGKTDLSVNKTLLQLLQVIAQTDKHAGKYRPVLIQYAEAVLAAAQTSGLLPADRAMLNEVIENMLQIEPPYFEAAKLKIN